MQGDDHWRPGDLEQITRRLGIAGDLSAPESRRFRSPDGLSLHALDWGGNGPAALLLHGGALTARTWDYVAVGLRGEFRLIALDMRGHGESDWAESYAVERSVADALAVLDALGIERAHVAGMSLGGLVGAELAFGFPRRTLSLTLIDIGPGSVFEASARMRSFVNDFAGAASVEDAVEQALRVNPLSDLARLRYRMETLLKRDEQGRWIWKRDARRVAEYPEILQRVGGLSLGAASYPAPFLLVRGARSKVLPEAAAAAFVARFPDGRSLDVDGAGHNVQEDNPAELLRALLNFWSGVGEMPPRDAR